MGCLRDGVLLCWRRLGDFVQRDSLYFTGNRPAMGPATGAYALGDRGPHAPAWGRGMVGGTRRCHALGWPRAASGCQTRMVGGIYISHKRSMRIRVSQGILGLARDSHNWDDTVVHCACRGVPSLLKPCHKWRTAGGPVMVTLQIALYGGACHAIMASASVVAHASALPRSLGALKWATCAVKGAQFQRVQVPPRQGSPRPGGYPSGGGGNEAVERPSQG